MAQEEEARNKILASEAYTIAHMQIKDEEAREREEIVQKMKEDIRVKKEKHARERRQRLLEFQQEEEAARNSIKNEEAASDIHAAFHVGQYSRNNEIQTLEQRLAESAAASSASSSASGPQFLESAQGAAARIQMRSSMSPSKLSPSRDEDIQVDLLLTPKKRSKISYTLSGDRMANHPKMIEFRGDSPAIAREISQMDRDEEFRLFPKNPIIKNFIPVSDRVESNRTIKLRTTPDLENAFEASGFYKLDHAMTTDFMIKVLQVGSVYAQLRKAETRPDWKFCITVVASIKSSEYQGRIDFPRHSKNKKWVTLSFEVDDAFRVGPVFHFCVQETHPIFITDEQRQFKYYLTPLASVVGEVVSHEDSPRLVLSCPLATIRGAIDFLKQVAGEHTSGGRTASGLQESYKALWNCNF